MKGHATHPVRKGTFFAAVAALARDGCLRRHRGRGHRRSSARAHPCVVAAGSGDQAFTRNFNPFNLGTQRDFTWGGIYENLLISTAVGGGRQYNLLGKSFTWSKDGKTLTIGVRPNVKWSDGKPLTAGRRPVQPHHRQAGQGCRPDQPRRREQQHRRRQARRGRQGRDSLQAGRLDVPRLPAAERPDRPEARLVEGQERHEVRQPEPRRLRPVQPRHALQRAVVPALEEPELLGEGPAADRLRAADLHGLERRGPAPDRERPGRLDAQLRAERRVRLPGEGSEELPQCLPHDGLPVSLTFNTTEYPYSLVAFRKGVSQAIDRKMVSKLGEYGYAPPTTALGLEFSSTRSGSTLRSGRRRSSSRPSTPAAARKTFTDARLHVPGLEAHGPEGRPGQLPDARDRRLVGLGRLAADHLAEPAGGRDRRVRQDRAGLAGMGVQQRDQRHQAEPDLVERRKRPDAVRVLLLALRPVAGRCRPARTRWRSGNFERNSNAQAAVVLRQFKGTLDRKKQLQAAYKLQEIFLTSCPTSRCSSARAGRPTAEVLQGLGHVAEPVRGPDLLDAAAGADLAPVAVLRRLQEGSCRCLPCRTSTAS